MPTARSACYEESVEFLRGAEFESGDTQALEQYMTTLVRLAWLYVARNDPRARTVLDRADELRGLQHLPTP